MSEAVVTRTEFEALQQEIARLRSELQGLRASMPIPEIDEETIGILSAAIAAYLGKRATIKMVRTLNQDEVGGWASQGRTRIYGSRQLSQTRGWH